MNLFNVRHTDVFRDVVLPFELNDVMLDGYSSFGGIPELLKPVDDSSGADGIMVTEEPCPAVMMMAGTPFPTQADPNSGCIYLGLINDYTGPYVVFEREAREF